MKNSRPRYEPTRDEIEAACHEIQKTWSEADERRHRKGNPHPDFIEIKTLKLTPRTAGFHRDILVKKAREWLGEGKKVKFQIRFRAREITYPEIGQEMLEGIATELGDVSEVEQAPKLEGWSMTLMLTPEGQKVKSQPAE